MSLFYKTNVVFTVLFTPNFLEALQVIKRPAMSAVLNPIEHAWDGLIEILKSVFVHHGPCNNSLRPLSKNGKTFHIMS